MIIRKTLLFIALVFSFRAHAQLCQGSLGDPIVNITFGSGANPGAPLSAAATNYQFSPNDCPNDGQYTVRNRTDNCFGASWHTLNRDHTGDANGYFMLVNASFQPSAFYVDTVNLFCSNTTYEFAAWVLNVMRTTVCGGQPTMLPNLSFSIEKTDGTVLQTYNTGDIPVQNPITWNQYGFFFTAPTGVNRVVLRITNNAPGGCGNDLALDDITFRPCGPLVDASITGNNGDVEICQGEAAQFNLNASLSSGFDDPMFQWQSSFNNGAWTDIPGSNTTDLIQVFAPNAAVGTYRYRLSVTKSENSSIPLCRVNSSVLTIKVHPNPEVNIQTNSPVCENSNLLIQASGGSDYVWTGPNSLTGAGPVIELQNAQPGQTGTYSVQVITSEGCSKTGSVNVIVNPRPIANINLPEVNICEGAFINLTASGGTVYQWSPASGLSASNLASPVVSPADSTRYEVIVSNNFSCSDTVYTQVNVLKNPVANAGPDQEIFLGQTATLSGSVSGTAISFSWSPDHAISGIDQLQPDVNPLTDTSYVLTVESGVGCGNDYDTVRVRVYKGIYIPTAFTPNNDGLNDVWRIPGLGIYKEHEVLVFNRYGQVVFSTKSNQPWDGTFKGSAQPTGTYPYLVKISEGNILMKGLVMIVR